MFQISYQCSVTQVVPKNPSKTEALCNILLQAALFDGEDCYPLAQSPSWRVTPWRLSATTHSIYSQLPSISGGRLLHHGTQRHTRP